MLPGAGPRVYRIMDGFLPVLRMSRPIVTHTQPYFYECQCTHMGDPLLASHR